MVGDKRKNGIIRERHGIKDGPWIWRNLMRRRRTLTGSFKSIRITGRDG